MRKFMKLFVKEIFEFKYGFAIPLAILLELGVIFWIDYPDKLEQIDWQTFYLCLKFSVGILIFLIISMIIRCLAKIKLEEKLK